MAKTERRVLGIVSVDSGVVIVGDPALVLLRRDEAKDGIDYSAVLAGVSEENSVQVAGRPVVQLQNFGGDGEYLVVGEFEDGEFMRAVIEFDPVELDES